MENFREYWMFRLLLNLLGYASVGVPIFLLVYLVKRRNLLDKFGSESTIAKVIRRLIYGEDASIIDTGKNVSSRGRIFSLSL